jgi:translation initiation factor SUI1
MNNNLLDELNLQQNFDVTQNFNKIHIKLLQRTGRKYITIVEDLLTDIHKKFIKNCKKKFNTNGWIDNNIIYLNGDNRENVKQLLINKYNYEDENIYIHGF